MYTAALNSIEGRGTLSIKLTSHLGVRHFEHDLRIDTSFTSKFLIEEVGEGGRLALYAVYVNIDSNYVRGLGAQKVNGLG